MTSDKKKIVIRFDSVTPADASAKARNLRDEILELIPDAEAEIVKDDPRTQDFGGTLVLALGTPAVIVLCKGIANYLARDRAKITIEADGKVIAEGVSGADAARIAEAFGESA